MKDEKVQVWEAVFSAKNFNLVKGKRRALNRAASSLASIITNHNRKSLISVRSVSNLGNRGK